MQLSMEFYGVVDPEGLSFLQLFPIVSHFSPVCTLTVYFQKMHSSIILPFMYLS